MKMSLLASLCGCVVVCFSLTAYAACVQPPSCEELGFTADASKCEGSFLKCPWDLSKAACLEKAPEAPLLILYGDGTVTKEILSNKTPIGIVFDETNKLAVALTDVKKDGSSGSELMYWSNKFYDIPGLENCSSSDITSNADISCGIDGRTNTDKILVCGNECGGTPAATAVDRYQPTNCSKDFCKKTKWFLASLRDLQNIYTNKAQLNTSLALLANFGATTIKDAYYWSSTEGNTDYAWRFDISNGVKGWINKNNYNYNYYVRPVLAF